MSTARAEHHDRRPIMRALATDAAGAVGRGPRRARAGWRRYALASPDGDVPPLVGASPRPPDRYASPHPAHENREVVR